MKKLFVLLVAALIMGACGSKDTKTENTEDVKAEISMENLVEISIPVVGMTCEGCENAVKKSIASLEGIAEVSASHVDSVAVVSYDATKTSPEDIQGKISEAGYTVKEEG